MAELHDLTALEQGSAIRAGEVSSAELVEHYLARIERLSDTVGAFVTVTAEAARSAVPRGPGPLVGVPTAVKDLNTTAGVVTEFGSATMKGYVPDVSDEVVLRLERGGLVSLGKTSTPEFGSPCYTEPDNAPPARTPWDLDRMAGGSSGGAAAAVAAGLVPLAQGSDGGGSIRIPASCCGLVGLKPSRGRVSGGPMYGDPVGLGTAGPLARTVRDAAALLDVLAGPAVGDPFWAPPPPTSFLAACDVEPGRLRVARFRTPVIADAPLHPAVVDAYESATRLLVSLGHDVEEIDVPVPPEAVATFETCWAVLTALSAAPPGTEHLLRPLTAWLQERGRAVSGPEFGLAVGEARRIASRAVRTLAPYDAVLTPTLAQPPLRIGEIRDDADPARDFENQKAFTPWTSAWNLTGMPAVSLPLHVSEDGLPVGVMLAGRPAEEHVLLGLSAQLEAAAPWADRTPPCW
ncbi:amidase [Nocardioides panacis]|uniref:Amidase n=1 Tax=Nocardioides panacis TaxID=2849501 RepID=A0A975Y107_9ACTN|nr:amidase [Nocardioides panacis]QWZ09023.1 amidase [Nocardioides panacis]